MKRIHSGRGLLCKATVFAVLSGMATSVLAEPPGWWTTRGVLKPETEPDHQAVVNLGQLKHIATRALDELKAVLPSNYRTTSPTFQALTDYVEDFVTETPDNQNVVNIIQLKTVASKFYDVLIEIGYTDEAPWTPEKSDDDYDPAFNSPPAANQGQLKNVFKFNPGLTEDNDAIPDWWEILHGLPVDADNGATDADLDLTFDEDEFLNWRDPNNYYSRPTSIEDPSIAKISGGDQQTLPGHYLTNPLVIEVTHNGNVLHNAPVKFQVISGDGVIATETNAVEPVRILSLKTGVDGRASIYFKHGDVGEVESTIIVTSGPAPATTFVIKTLPCPLTAAPSSLVLDVLAESTAQSGVTLESASPISFQYSSRFLNSLNTSTVLSEGDDEYGYRWDSSKTGKFPYKWEDIAQSGTRLNTLSVSSLAKETINLPFNFPFYGADYSQAHVSTAGYLTFTTSDPQPEGMRLPSSESPPALVAAFFCDLAPDKGGDIYWSGNADRVIVQYNNVRRAGSLDKLTFQIVLSPDGTITFNYKHLEGALNDSVIGIQNSARDKGFSIRPGAVFVEENLAVRISTHGSEWVKLDLPSGEMNNGETKQLTFTASPRHVDTGDYVGAIQFYGVSPGFAPDSIETTVRVRVPVTATDTDGDGLEDSWEQTHFGNLAQFGKDDADGDGISNQLEAARGSDPNQIHSDNDGLTDAEEIFTYGTNPTNPDSDGDGLLDGAEVNSYKTDPAVADTDEDTLDDGDEITAGTKPNSSDTDGDSMLDGWEVAYALNPLSTADIYSDLDGDRIPNVFEHAHGTNPTLNTSVPTSLMIVDPADTEDYQTLAAAYAGATDLDIIEVHAGTYSQLVCDSSKRLLWLAPARSNGRAIIEATVDGPSLTFQADTFMDGFVVTHEPALQGTGLLITRPEFSEAIPLVRLTNCLFTGNAKTGRGGAVEIVFGRLEAVHCTFSGNPADTGASVFLGNTSSFASIQNCILWNANSTGKEIYPDKSSRVSVSASVIRDGLYGAVSLDPSLRPDGRLRHGSPAISAGSSTPLVFDIDAESRLTSTPSDAGMDEFVDGDGDHLPDWFENAGFTDPLANPDSDGLNNLQEYNLGTDPGVADSDGDGSTDGQENTNGTDPRQKSSGLIAHWPFSETSGSTTADVVGANVGTLRNSPIRVPGLDGGKALAFNGTNQDVLITESPVNGLNFDDDSFSLATWFKTASTIQQRLISKGISGSSNGYFLTVGRIASGKVVLCIGAGGVAANSIGVGTVATFNDDQWHLAVATVNRATSKVRIYVDGQPQALQKATANAGTVDGEELDFTAVASLVNGSSTVPVALASDSSAGGGRLQGTMDDARVYNRVISAAEVRVLYHQDSDQDGLSDIEELELGTLPNDNDSDNDGIRDGFEQANGLDPLENPNPDPGTGNPGGLQITILQPEHGSEL